MLKTCILPLVLLTLCAAVVIGGPPASAATTYSISQVNGLTNLGVPYGLSADRSKIAGMSTGQAYVQSAGVKTDLGNFPGFSFDAATDINAAGVAVGWMTNQGGGYTLNDRAFVYSGGSMTMLPILTGTGRTHAYGINDAGTIVGVSANNKPFTYSGGNALTQLATPAGGVGAGSAHAINNAGDIVGWAGTATQRVPALWDDGVAASFLAMPAGAINAEARLINDAGVIAGTATYANGTRAFLYDASGAAVDMGTLAANNNYSDVFDINSWRQAVGTSQLATSPFTNTPFLWDSGVMVDLNSLLPANSGWVLSRAISINDAGEVVGTGTFNGTPSGFRLTPIPEPGAFAGMAIMALAAAVVRRRRRRHHL